MTSPELESAVISPEKEEEEEKTNGDSIIDVSGKILDLDELDSADETAEGLYLFKNTFNLVPRSIGGLGKLKTLKFFSNEINLFPPEFSSLVDLECMQVKVSNPCFTGLSLGNLKGLKELELSKDPPRSSALVLLREIVVLKRLKKLSICHFSIKIW